MDWGVICQNILGGIIAAFVYIALVELAQRGPWLK